MVEILNMVLISIIIQNTGIESYVVDLGYMSIEKDLSIIINNMSGYIDGILNSVKTYCNL